MPLLLLISFTVEVHKEVRACEENPKKPTISVSGAQAGSDQNYYVVEIPAQGTTTVTLKASGQTPCPTDDEKCTCQYNSDKAAQDTDGDPKFTFIKPLGTQDPNDGPNVNIDVTSSTAPNEYKFKVTKIEQLYKPCSKGWSGGVTSKSNTQSSDEVTILVCQVKVKCAKQIACDGESLDVDLEVSPESVKSSLSDGSFTCKKPDGGTNFENPSGQGSQIASAGGSDYTKWKVDNVRWYSTQNDHCNETSLYEVVGTVKVKGAKIQVTKASFTASTVVGGALNQGCFFGRAKFEMVFDGEPAIVTQKVDDTHWETTVSAGTFKRSCDSTAEVSGSPNSQFYAMISGEENAHVAQMENPTHAIYGKVFLATKIITEVTSKNPFRSFSEENSKKYANEAWDKAVKNEIDRSNAYLTQRNCDIEKEAKQQAGSSFCFTVWCTYGCR